MAEPKYKTIKEAREAGDKKQAEFDADPEHQKASRNLDKAFGYGRLNIGQSHTYDSPLTVRDIGLFDYKDPKDRPLKQRTWSEEVRKEKDPGTIRETGGYNKGGAVKQLSYAKGGKVIKSENY